MPALDRAVTHGIGLYETLKLSAGVPLFFAEHMDRLQAGLQMLEIAVPWDRATIARAIVELAAAGGIADGGCRVLVTGGADWGGPSLLIRNDVREQPDTAPARGHPSRHPRERRAQGHDLHAVASGPAGGGGGRRRRRHLRRRRGPHVRGRHLQHLPGARRRPGDDPGRGRHPAGCPAGRGRTGRRDGRHHRGRGLPARGRPARRRRHVPHEQRARHRRRRDGRRARAARRRRHARAPAAARRRRRAGRRRRVSRRRTSSLRGSDLEPGPGGAFAMHGAGARRAPLPAAANDPEVRHEDAQTARCDRDRPCRRRCRGHRPCVDGRRRPRLCQPHRGHAGRGRAHRPAEAHHRWR